MKNKRVIIGIGVSACLALSVFTVSHLSSNQSNRNLSDEALLSIIKNDQKAFESFIAAGGKLDSKLEVEGAQYSISELLVKYERIGFIKYLSDKKIPLGSSTDSDSDMWSLAVYKNNPELLAILMKAYPEYKLNSKTYTHDKRNLLHLASVHCSNKVVGILDKNGMDWNDKDAKGATPLTLAAENDCLHILSYWKEHGADFKSQDGRGLTALNILLKKKDAALMAFADSFIERAPASVITVAKAPEVPNFYKKRKIPKDNLANRDNLIEPGERPDEANDTAEYSEFSD